MTPLQQLIYDYILANQPICDLCVAQGLGYERNQDANGPCNQLAHLGHINRINGHCERCNSNKLLNRVI